MITSYISGFWRVVSDHKNQKYIQSSKKKKKKRIPCSFRCSSRYNFAPSACDAGSCGSLGGSTIHACCSPDCHSLVGSCLQANVLSWGKEVAGLWCFW